MRVLQVVGAKKVGKTTFIEQILPELSRFGLKVGTLKHTCHDIEWDSPQKDSLRHFQAGACCSAVMTETKFAVKFQPPPVMTPLVLERVLPFFEGFDLLIIEGLKEMTGKKIEVTRQGVSKGLLTPQDQLVAVVGDCRFEAAAPFFTWQDISALAAYLKDLSFDL